MKEINSIPIPDEYVCPITHELMGNPVTIADGYTYEYEAIIVWLQEHNTSPITGKILANHSLTPNLTLKDAIDSFIKANNLSVPEAESNIPGNTVLGNEDLHAGDVLLKYKDDSLTNKVIFAANIVHSRHYREELESHITHAAICIGKGGTIAEASADGLMIRHLPTNDHYDWEVFRYTDQETIDLAKDLAYSLTIECREDKNKWLEQSGRYAIVGAVTAALYKNPKSLYGRRQQETERIVQFFGLSKEKYYCSHFVAFVYALASQICNPGIKAIDKDYRVILPANLYKYLKENANWQHVGYLNNKPRGKLYREHHRVQPSTVTITPVKKSSILADSISKEQVKETKPTEIPNVTPIRTPILAPMSLEEILLTYFMPLKSFSRGTVQNEPLWQYRQSHIIRIQLADQLRKVCQTDAVKSDLDEFFLAQHVLGILSGPDLSFSKLLNENKKRLLELAGALKNKEGVIVNNDYYAISVLLTLLIRDPSKENHIVALELLKQGQYTGYLNLVDTNIQVDLSLPRHKALCDIPYIEFAYADFSGLDLSGLDLSDYIFMARI